MKPWFKSFILTVVLVGAVSSLSLAGTSSDLVLRRDITPPGPWALTASYCYFGHCTEHDRVPTYWRSRNSFETGEECVARLEEVTKRQSRRMALHRTLFCGRTFPDPGPDDLTKPRSEFDDPVPDDLKPWE